MTPKTNYLFSNKFHQYHLFSSDYAIAKEILVNKYCTKVKLWAAVGETLSSRWWNSEHPLVKLRAAIVKKSRHFPDEWLKKFPMQCNKDAARFFEKVLQMYLLLIDISGSLEIFYNISVILPEQNHDTNTSLSFLSRTSLWYRIRLH